MLKCQQFVASVLYSVLSDILVKNELYIPLERGPNFLSTGEGFICLSPPRKLKIVMLFCSIYKKTISFSAIVFEVILIQWPMIILSRDWVSSVPLLFYLHIVTSLGEIAKNCIYLP